MARIEGLDMHSVALCVCFQKISYVIHISMKKNAGSFLAQVFVCMQVPSTVHRPSLPAALPTSPSLTSLISNAAFDRSRGSLDAGLGYPSPSYARGTYMIVCYDINIVLYIEEIFVPRVKFALKANFFSLLFFSFLGLSITK